MKVKIKKLKEEIERNNSNELIIDRAKGGSKEFEELDGNEDSVGEKEEKLSPETWKRKFHFKRKKWEFPEERNDPNKEGRKSKIMG